ncbi:hypothetical protein I4U23_004118 [Adineta vaga]|nr:hypothetical protein I4U23_004118 [Adineta vaga]
MEKMNLFHYTTRFDIFLLLIGVLSAIGHGAIEPLIAYFLSTMIGTFLDQPSNLCQLNFTEQSSSSSTINFREKLHLQALYLSGIGCISIVLTFVQTSTFALSCERQIRKLRENVFRILLQAEISYFDIHTTGELTTILNNNINKIHDGIGEKLGLTIQFLSKFIIGMTIGFIYGWKMTLVILSLAPILWIVLLISSKMTSKVITQELQAYERAGTIAEEVFSNIRTVFSFNGVEHEQARYEKEIEFVYQQGINKGVIAGLLSGSMYTVLLCSYALAFWYGHRLIQNETYNIANVFLVFLSVIVAIFSLGQTGTYRQSIHQAMIAAVSIQDILHLKKSTCVMNTKKSQKKFCGRVKFDNVHFSYPLRPDKNVLHGLNFEATSGETIALVGTSGCGKSTCMQLLQQFYKPAEGQILLDDKPIEQFNSQELSQNIGVVNQESILFSTTILENIKYGQPNATFDEIQTAAMAANAHNFIMSLPEAYNTIVGERGTQLSGGERQRIVIARALIKNPILLLLDEATSALDNQSEKIVQEVLKNLSKDRTTIIVAHRLSTVRHAQKIIVLDNGSVIEEGDHETLMSYRSTYYHLVKAQLLEEHIDDDESQLLMSNLNFSEDFDDSTSDNELTTFTKNRSTTTDDIEKKTRWPSLAILKLNRPELPSIVIGTLASVYNGGLEPLTSVLLSEIITVYQECDTEVQDKEIKFYVICFILLAILTFLTMFTQDFIFAYSGESLTKRLRTRAFQTILRQEITWFDHSDNNTGVLCTRLSTDTSAVQGVAGIRLGTILSSFANLGIGIIIAFLFGWRLTLIALAFIPFILIGALLQTYLMQGFFTQDSQSFERAGAVVTETLENIRTVRQLMIEEHFLNNYCQLLDIPYRSSLKRIFVFSLIYSSTSSTIFFAMAAVFFYGGILVEQNIMTFKDVLIIFNCIIFGAQIVGENVALAPDYGKAVSAARKLLVLFARDPTISIGSHGLKLKNYIGDLQFKDVSFAYPTRPSVSILNNFNLNIQTGQRIALVGSSGSGKSTLFHLLERFYHVQNGSILIDSQDLRDMDLNWWRSQIGLVTQEPILFNASIAENLAYGDLSRHVSMDEIIEAAKQANIHDFIQQLPQGYQTCVGSKGNQLSGGEKQRIAIGRVLIRNPKVILLDEATSALDNESEKIVTEALAKTLIGRTSVVVAHRLSTIQDADLICVLHHGYIIESGTHHQLIMKKGFYYKSLQCVREP